MTPIYFRQGGSDIKIGSIHQRQGGVDSPLSELYQRQGSNNIQVFAPSGGGSLYVHNCMVTYESGTGYRMTPIDNAKDFYAFFTWSATSYSTVRFADVIGDVGAFSAFHVYILNAVPVLETALTSAPIPSGANFDFGLSFYTADITQSENTGYWYNGTERVGSGQYYYPGYSFEATIEYDGEYWSASSGSLSIWDIPATTSGFGKCILAYKEVGPDGHVSPMTLYTHPAPTVFE